MDKKLQVRKRNGSLEDFDIEKINAVIDWAINGYKDASASDILVNAQLNIQDGITTSDIHKVLIESAVNLFTEDTPDYQWVASRLMNYELRKSVWGGKNPPKLYDHIVKSINSNLYDKQILDWYTEEEINKLDEKINHERDYDFTYAGIKQLCDKYLVQNRKSKQIYETPQFAYMLIAMVAFSDYSKSSRFNYIKRAYDAFSKHKISLSTPVIAGVRTNIRQFSSCCLINIDDSMDSITTTWQAIGYAISKRFGIGLNIGRLRAIGTEIRGGETIHTGIIPFLKAFEGIVKSCHQGGIRQGSCTVNIPFWHLEIEDVVVLKNNGGTEDNRVRHLDYTVQFSKLFYQRAIANQNITLFSPHEVPDLYDAFGLPAFDDLYEKYEKDKSIKYKKSISAMSLMSLFVKERTETGRIYILNIDHANEHSSWADKIELSQLCVEIVTPTTPLTSFNDPNGEIGICCLGGINVLNIRDEKDYENTCDIIVRVMEELLEKQEYFIPAAKKFIIERRSLGIGITNFAAYLAKNGYKYTDTEAPNIMDQLAEKHEWYLLKASLNIAKEKGPCSNFKGSKFSQGILPIDTYKKSIDEVITRKPSYDWEWMRGQIKQYGLRHSTLTSQMPFESSSVCQNSTNGIEPPRQLLSYKGSKSSSIPVLVPEHKKWNYTLAFEMGDNIGILNINAALQKWCDMAISTNVYYKYANYPDGQLPDMVVIKDILYAYKMGLVSLYYSNTSDSKEMAAGCGEDGSCSL